MADILNSLNNANNGNNTNSSNQQNTANNANSNKSSKVGPDIDLLKSIDATLKTILREGPNWSQSSARDAMPGRRYAPGRQSYTGDDNRWRVNRNRRSNFSSSSDEFVDGFNEALMEGLLGSDFKQSISDSLSGFADALGVEVGKLPKELGKQLSKELLNTGPGKQLTSTVDSWKSKAGTYMKDKFMSGVKNYDKNNDTNYADKFQRAFDSAKENRSRQSASAVANSSMTDFSQVNADLISQLQHIVFNVRDVYQAEARENNKIIEETRKSDPELADMLGQDSEMMQMMREDLGLPNIDDLMPSMSDIGNFLTDGVLSNVGQGAQAALGGAQTAAQAGAEGLSSLVSGLGGAGELSGLAGGASAAGAGLAGLAAAAWPVAAALAAMAALTLVVNEAMEALEPAIEGTKTLFESASNSANRYQESRKKNLEAAEKRMLADMEAVMKAPFDILEEAAQNVYDIWDKNMRTITATQGYNKADLQSLMSAYSQRIQEEGLSSVINGADITENLASVLESGLSGKVAEEFAYLATKLNAAVPTQDFFQYGETYASIAANAIKMGQSEAEAISYANSQMEQFASNVLYASRQISGGFSSGLKDAQSLFEESAKIAAASKTGQVSEISGVLTSVAATVGAIAPDLSSSIVESVTKTLTGGNNSDIVALRSLAGVNASNTEFLKMFSENPKELFVSLFKNLSDMQNMSNDNYMEVAEGLSEIFGLSMDAFARVDFSYLADAVSQMQVNTASLSENISLLASGETTTTAEQLKQQQINEYMIEEGLAYMIDNEVARMIQQHMWDEQLAREIQEATYAVELQGSALQFLEGISQTVQNIIDFLNPFSVLKDVANLTATAVDAVAQQADIYQLLELGKVGEGDAKSLYNLTTTNKDLNLTDSIVTLMGGFSAHDAAMGGLNTFNKMTNGVTSGFDIRKSTLSGAMSLMSNALGNSSSLSASIGSKYAWANIGKSTAAAMMSATNSSSASSMSSSLLSSTNPDAAKGSSNAAFSKFLNTLSTVDVKETSYDEWKKSAVSFGIKDFDAALEEYGRSESELQSVFNSKAADEAHKEEAARNELEEKFWESGMNYWDTVTPNWRTSVVEPYYNSNLEYHRKIDEEHFPGVMQKQDDLYKYMQETIAVKQQIQIDRLTSIERHIDTVSSNLKTLLNNWVDYYIDRTVYRKDTGNAHQVAQLQSAEKRESGEAILALARSLQENTESFKDPQVQTNVLLAKILLVAQAIMEQNNTVGSVSLPNTLAALGLGITE